MFRPYLAIIRCVFSKTYHTTQATVFLKLKVAILARLSVVKINFEDANPNGQTNSTDEPHTTQNRRNHTHNKEEKASSKLTLTTDNRPNMTYPRTLYFDECAVPSISKTVGKIKQNQIFSV
jgi:hypothetical protein